MKAPLKKRMLARYPLIIEVFGYIFMGGLVAIMVGSRIYKIDDSVKFTTKEVTAHTEPVILPEKARIESIAVKEAETVQQGQTLFVLTSDPADLAAIDALNALKAAEQTLQALPSSVKVPPDLLNSIQQAVQQSTGVATSGRTVTVGAPSAGIMRGETTTTLSNLAPGAMVGGKIGAINDFGSLRFTVAIAGANAERVRINRLAVGDVLDWRTLTRAIMPPEEAEGAEGVADPPIYRHIQSLCVGNEILKSIQSGKRPIKRDQPGVVDLVNSLLYRPDFFIREMWGKDLGVEIEDLLARGVANLDQTQLVRLNRLLIERALPGVFAPSLNEHQVVKARIRIPVPAEVVDGRNIPKPPKDYPILGRLWSEPKEGKVVIDLPGPDPAVVDYLTQCQWNSNMERPVAEGTIVVRQISAFDFLFRSE